MTTTREMEAALKKVRSFSKNYRGNHAEFFAKLYEDVREIPSRQSENFEKIITALYHHTISNLVAQSSPPSQTTLNNICQKLSHLTDTRISDVELVSPVRDQPAAPRTPESREIGMLSRLLPKPRKLSDIERHLLNVFKEQLPPSSSFIRQERNDGDQE